MGVFSGLRDLLFAFACNPRHQLSPLSLFSPTPRNFLDTRPNRPYTNDEGSERTSFAFHARGTNDDRNKEILDGKESEEGRQESPQKGQITEAPQKFARKKTPRFAAASFLCNLSSSDR
jgi:hypothetical protein